MAENLANEQLHLERRLPWWIAGGAFVLYLAFLQRYPSFEGLSALVKMAGWDWHRDLAAPLHQIVTYPIRWLPAGIQFWTLNAVTAAFAAATLGLLARSVSLLPMDRTPLQRKAPSRQRDCWIPPVFAAAICGLQLSFWENAIVGTGEMLDLLILAWLIHQLLEYRRERKLGRLYGFAFVYGLAAVNNYAMIAMFPAFLAALYWIVGRTRVTGSLVLRLLGLGMAGLTLYAFLPAVTRWSNPDGADFWTLVRSYLGYQLSGLRSVPRYVIVLCSLTSLVPVAWMGLVWGKRVSKSTLLGRKFSALVTLLIHAFFLMACVAVAFDPKFSPRQLAGGRAVLLPLYYLGALAIGYFTEFFLQVLQYPHRAGREKSAGRVELLGFSGAAWVLRVGAALVLVTLAIRTMTTGDREPARAMSHMARAMADSLPAEGAVVLSDDLFQLYSLQHALLRKAPRDRFTLVHTAALTSPDYHRYLRDSHPQQWPPFQRRQSRETSIDAANLMNALLAVNQTSPLYYIQPSFGLFFEFFELRPRGLVYEMVRSPTNNLSGETRFTPEMQEQDAYLQEFAQREIRPLVDKVDREPADEAAGVPMLGYLTAFYSRMLNQFGVHLQRAGNSDRAAVYFKLALEVNPSNVAAYINRMHSEHLRTGTIERESQAHLLERLKPYEGRWEAILKVDGPVDEPVVCHQLAKRFADSGHFRQAARELERVFRFSPDNRLAQLDFAMTCIGSAMPEAAETAVAAFRRRYDTNGLEPREEAEISRVLAWVEALKRNLPGAEKILESAQENYPAESLPWDAMVEIYLRFGMETNAVQVMKRRMEAQPGNLTALVNYGGILVRRGQFADALDSTGRALDIDPSHEDARFNRALIYAALQRWDEAQQDFYRLTLKTGGKHQVKSLYGLAEVLFHKTNEIESVRYYKEFLQAVNLSGVTLSAEAQNARDRLRLLEQQGFNPAGEPGYIVPSTGLLRH